MDELSALADAAARGKGGVVLVEGEAGIGKTQLVTATLTRAETSGFAAFRAAAEALERGRPFGVVADALELHPRSDDPERAEIGRLLTGEPSPDETSNPYADPTFRIIESVGAILERLASKRPVAVALEDLHWADVSTLGAVVSLARRFAAMPVLMLLTMRPSPRSHDLDGAVERLWSRGARQLRLSPLPDDAVVALTAEVATAAPGPSLLRQVRGASGNPLYVIELVRALRDAGALRVAGGVAESDETPLPSTLRETILRRLSFLPADALELLRLASVLGSTFAADDLAAVAGQPARDLLTRLQEPVRAGVIGEAGGALAFRHELIRAAVYDDIPGTIRSRLHREAAEALATAGASPARVGEQLALAGDPEAVPWLRRAARHAASRSPLVATDLLRRALDLAAFDHPKREAMTSELLTSLVIVGRMAEVEPLARDILARDPPPLLEASIRSNLANALLYREIRPDAAREQFARAAAVADIPDWLASWNVALAALVQVLDQRAKRWPRHQGVGLDGAVRREHAA
ncbi:MAG: AAA family ATPase, partial [Actinobacteria bacterium]|nr:AAA family ATPase [Actinomycetota bacterium]